MPMQAKSVFMDETIIEPDVSGGWSNRWKNRIRTRFVLRRVKFEARSGGARGSRGGDVATVHETSPGQRSVASSCAGLGSFIMNDERIAEFGMYEQTDLVES